jgi:hypothetical protein
MGRRIVWTDYESSDSAERKDDFSNRLLKYIPADVVGLWIAGNSLIQSQPDASSRPGLLWLLFVMGLVFTFLWTRKQTSEPGKPIVWRQILLCCVTFTVWVFAIGGPFAALPFYQPIQGSLLLLFYSAAIPFLPAPPPEQQ